MPKDRFHVLINSIPQFIWEARADGSGVFCNKRMLQYLDKSLEEVQELGWLETVHPDDRAQVRDAWQAAVRKGAEYSIEFRIRNGKTGEYCWFLTRAVPHRNSRGKISRWFGTCTDIHLRKKIEQSLRKSEERLKTVLEKIPGGVFAHDLNGKFLLVNDKAAQNTGYTKEELLRLSVDDIDPDSVTYEDRNQIWLSLSPNQTFVLDSTHVRKDGSTYHAEVHLSAIELDGQPIILAIAFDVTKRKMAEQELFRLKETLEQRVAERTELAQARTHQLQALAVELIESEERERRRMAEILHDDLQQMLASARYLVQVALDSNSLAQIEEVEHLLEESIRKSRHLSHELSPAVLHQAELDTALHWLAGKVREQSGLEVAIETSAHRRVESPHLKVFLFRAVQELLFNIAKHAGVQHARVVLSGTEQRVSVAVCDTGKGFDPDILDRGAPKSGLGLLSIRERASYIGGEFVIQSAPGKGSRLTLSVPTAPQPVQAPAAALAKTARAAERRTRLKGAALRVLFADDHKVLRQGLIRMVAGKPDIIVAGEAANGREALELARQIKPDVIVMDVSMPEMDGIAATRSIKAEMPQVRVIGLSMHDDEHTCRSMREAGAEAFVSKTSSSSELLKAIYGIA